MLKKIYIKIFSYSFWLFIFILIAVLHSKNNINSDEGVILADAWSMINGQKLYIDIFEFTPPGIYYTIYWLWRLFTPSYIFAKILAMMVVFLCAIGIYKIYKEINKNFTDTPSRSKIYIYISLIIFIISTAFWPIISYHIFNLFFMIWATYFFIIALIKNNNFFYALSGFFTGFSILYMQNKGILFIAVLTSYLLFISLIQKKIKNIFYLFLYLFFAILPILSLFAVWPEKTIIDNLFIFPFFNYTETAKTPFYLLLFFLIFWLISYFIFKKHATNEIKFLFILQLVLLLSTYVLADIFHLTVIAFPFYILLPALIDRLSGSLYKYFYCFLTIIIVFVVIFPSIVFTARHGLNFFSQKYDFIDLVNQNCQGSPYIYAGPFMPGMYFETKKIVPAKNSWLITNLHTNEQFIEAKKMIEEKQPSCAILNYAMVKKYKYNQDNPVDNFIRQNYNQIYKNGDTMILKNKNL